MKRTGPMMVVLVVGILMMIHYFVPHTISQVFYSKYIDALRPMAVPAMFLGVYSVILVNWSKIKRKSKNWQYSAVTLGSLFLMFFLGILGTKGGSLFQWMFTYVLTPIDATMFSLLAFYIASASYKAFRARSMQATILLIAALIVMIGQVALYEYIPLIGDWFPPVAQWILDVPNMAAKRGIQLGVGLGIIATSMKIVFGIERSYLGGKGE